MDETTFKNVGLILLALVCAGVVLGVVVWVGNYPTTRRIDCSLAEFHPDYPPAVREQCRLIRSNRLL